MSVRRIERPLKHPYCWNCGADPGGRRLVTIREAAQYCNVSVNAVYRWMERELIEWVYNAGGKRLIYKDSLIRRAGEDSPAHECAQQEAEAAVREGR